MATKNIKKCIVMLSGGLDSRLALRIMQEQGFEITALYFNLPFGTGCCSERCSFSFSQVSGVKMKILDCSKGELLKEYLEVINHPKYNRGAGINPCIDCRLFMFKKTKEFADKNNIDLIVTGEVLGERPMSQHRKALDIVEEESGLKGRILRPLSAKLLPETEAEKKGIVNRDKLLDIQGRRRTRQIELAKEFKISFPSPAGGCILCEKNIKKRLSYLVKRGMDEEEIKLVAVGRHFLIDNCWVVLGKNKSENEIIGKLKGKEIILPCDLGPTAVILDKCNNVVKDKVKKLVLAYSKEGSLEDKKGFEKYKL